MRTIYVVFNILIATACLNGLTLCQSNDKITESDTKSSVINTDGEKTEYQNKVAVDPGGLPSDVVTDNPPIIHDQKSLIKTAESSLTEIESAERIKSEKNENIQTGQYNKVVKETEQSTSSSQPAEEQVPDTSDDKKISIESTQEKPEVSDSPGVKAESKQFNEASVSESSKSTEKSETKEEQQSKENKQTQPDTVLSEEPKQQYPKQPGGHSEGPTSEIKKELTNKTNEVEKAKPKDVPADEKLPDKDDSELETFSEYWTKSVMEEEEKSKQSGDKPGPNGSVSKQPKRKHNYASRECGAKILGSNPEAENVRGILNSNKDDYMINPCKARKWFIIELCEPVRLSTVEIASFELFSSQPKYFTVGFSDRYPTKEWKTYGFDTKDERVLQSFDIPEEDVYYKYVRVEITDHYGEEHFCPLTLFKVYGIAVEYDDDFIVPSEDDNDLDPAVLQTMEEITDHESPKNLFSSAKDTVMKIVKKVLNVEEKKLEEGNGTDSGNMTENNINNTSKLNTSNDGFMLPCVPEVGKPDIAPTEPEPVNEKIHPNPPYHFTSTLPPDSKGQVHSNEIKLDQREPSASIVRKLEDHEQIPSEEKPEAIVTLLDSESDTGSLHQKVSECLDSGKTNTTTDTNTSKKSNNVTADLCAYVQIMMLNKVVHTCASQMVTASKSGTTDSSFILIDKTVTDVTTSSAPSSSPEDKLQEQKTKITSESDSNHITTALKQTTTDGFVEKKITSETLSVEASKSAETEKQSLESKVELSTSSVTMATQTKQEEIVSSPSSLFVTIESSVVTCTMDEISKPAESLPPSSDSSIQDQITLEPSIVSSSVVVNTPQEVTPALQGTSDSHRLNTEDTASISKPSQTVESISNQVQMEEQKTRESSELPTEKLSTAFSIEPTLSTEQTSESQSIDPSTQQGQTDQMSTQQPIKDQVPAQQPIKDQVPAQQPVKDQAESFVQEKLNDTSESLKAKPAAPKRDLGLVRVPIMPFQKRDPIMRLSNRIKALELNVSLSSRFLDKMSQKFKRQSEELMKTLNKTIGQFENVTREAEIREKKQKEQISVLEAQVENLTSIVVRLTQKMDSIDKEVTDRQMVWTSVEVVILIIIFLICLRKGKSTPAQIPPEVQRLLETMPQRPDLSLNPRRNSFSVVQDKPAITNIGPVIQKYQSESALAASTDTLDNDTKKFDPGGSGVDHHLGQMENGKEITKKKKKKKKCHDNNKPRVSNESLTDINSAGLLFGAGGITTNSDNCDILKRSSSHGILTRMFGDKTADRPNENPKKVTIGPTTVAAYKPPRIPNHCSSSGNIRHKRHSVDESGSKVKKNDCVSYSQSYTSGIQEVPKGKSLPNGNSSKFNDSKGQFHPYKGPMLNGKVAKHGQTKHVRGKSADFTPTDEEKSSGIWMNLIGRK